MLRRICVLASLVILCTPAAVSAQSMVDFKNVPLPDHLLAPRVSVVARTSFLEGPAFDAQGDLYFSDLIGNRILRMSPAGAVSVFRADSGRTNGNTFDAEGRLVSCEGAEQGPGGRRRIVRTDMKTGQVTVLTDRYEGKRYNSPNDVCVDTKGRIWFTDPYYGEDRSSLEMGAQAVYRIDTDGTVKRVLSQPDIQRPNGIAITPDAQNLYVVDSNSAAGGNRLIRWYRVMEDGGVKKNDGDVPFVDFGKGRGADGIRLDVEGRLWAAAGIAVPRTPGETTDVPPGIYIFEPQDNGIGKIGRLLGRIPIPEDVITNLAFGGLDRKTLYVTAGKSIFKVPIAVSGYALYPPLQR